MNFKRTDLSSRILISVGLLFVTIPQLFAHYFHLPDFIHGFTTGVGLALETWGLIRLKQIRRPGGACW